ncbi:hypothetical protein GIB67_043161 [Kingdonia uniflora]|uniref:RNase H type-1 domain-containing protein n=1 Tax=Kingdonia uniflora TaxID=39325 RepID=A0A7J7L1B1_9MAGN|nr:hypothetical protein GIB67_011260 [Kingdonia uniflora]KAF6167300.1 hypothetical protein GIB67_043161 [Kingdonia uniflora]
MPSLKVESGHQDTVHAVVMDYYGRRMATASSDTTIKIIGVNTSSSQHLATLTGHQGPVWQVAWAHPKFGSLLASCSYDGRVIIWKEGNQNEWTQAHVFDDHKSSVNSICWAPHELGLSLACGSSDGNISVFTARSDGGWDTTRINQAHPVGVTSVSWAPAMAPGALVGSGSHLADPVQKFVSGGCDNTVKVWKLYNGTWTMDCFPALQMHSDWVRDVAWAPNLGLPKSTIASASQDGTVIIWTVAKEGDQWEGKILMDFKTPVWTVAWSLTGHASSRAADAEEAEAISVIRGMRAARSAGLERVILFTDCRRLVRAFELGSDDLSWGSLTLAPDMLGLASSFTDFRFRYISRSLNFEAHALAAKGPFFHAISIFEPLEANSLVNSATAAL